MSESLKFENIVKVNTSGYTLAMAVTLDGKELPATHKNLVNLLATVLTPRPASKQGFDAVNDEKILEGLKQFSSKNPKSEVKLYWESPVDGWQVARVTSRGMIAKFAEGVISLNNLRKEVESMVTEFSVKLSTDGKGGRKGKTKTSAAIDFDV